MNQGVALYDWERQAIAEARRAHEKVATLAAEFHCNIATISRIAIREGVPSSFRDDHRRRMSIARKALLHQERAG